MMMMMMMMIRNPLDPNENVRVLVGTLLTGHAGGLYASRHDSIKRTLAQVLRDTMHDIHLLTVISFLLDPP